MINFEVKKKKMIESEFEFPKGINCSEYDDNKIFTSDIYDSFEKKYKHILTYKETIGCDLMRIEYSQDEVNKCIVIEEFKYEKSSPKNHIACFLDFCFLEITKLAHLRSWNTMRTYNFTVFPQNNVSFIHMLWFNNCELNNKSYIDIKIQDKYIK